MRAAEYAIMIYNSEELGGGAHKMERERAAGMVKEPVTLLPLAPASSGFALRWPPLPPHWRKEFKKLFEAVPKCQILEPAHFL
jgi:hypothetical protein